MSSVNKVILVGNVGQDPETRSLTNGGEVVNLSVATSEKWKDRDGNAQEKTEWHRVVIWNEHIAKVAKQYVRKGSKVYLEGQLQTRKWTDNNGVEKYSTEVVLQKFRGELVLLGDKGDARGHTADDARNSGGGRGNSAPSRGGFDPGFDDDVPFLRWDDDQMRRVM